jgi:hypothetical protein
MLDLFGSLNNVRAIVVVLVAVSPMGLFLRCRRASGFQDLGDEAAAHGDNKPCAVWLGPRFRLGALAFSWPALVDLAVPHRVQSNPGTP